MAVYENVPLIELERELLTYAPCWGTVIFVGVAIEEGGKFIPLGVQIWARDETDEETEIYGPPTLPHDIRMYRIAKKPTAAIVVIKQIFNQESIQLAEIHVDFQRCTFRRAAFLGSHDYDNLYAKELDQRVKGWPKLFLEGGLQNREVLEKHIQSIEEELRKVEYNFHTLRDASNHLLDFPFSPHYFMGAISGVLRIPVKVNARVEGKKLEYGLDLPKALAHLPLDVRYVATSDKGDRDEPLAVPAGEEQEDRVKYTASVLLKPEDRVLIVVLALNGRRVDSSRITDEKELPTKIELEKMPGLITPYEDRDSGLPTEEQFECDAFVSHASEDKESFVRGLAQELVRRGVRVWYDEFTLSVGDSLRRSIDKGLAKSRYGIVVLSPRFFDKEWPRRELDGLVVRERNGQKVILPVWLDVDAEDVASYSLPLVDRVAAKANEGLDKVVAKLLLVLKPEALTTLNSEPRGSVAVCRLTEAQAHEMGKTLSRLVGLEYRVEDASDVETILHRAVRMVVQEYSLIPEIALMLGVFTVETDPSQGGFILKGNPDICLFAEQLVHGERPHIPELEA